MQPFTRFSRPLSGTLRIDDFDDEPCSSSESWLLVSESRADPEVPLTSVASVACQTTTPLPAQDQPRANLKKNLLLHREEPLQPPTFKLKAKLPRLHYGGLEMPELHCFTSSLAANSDTDTQVYNSFMRPTAKSLPSPATFRKATASLQSTAQKDESDADRARSLLRDIFYDVGFSSKLYCEIYTSAFIDQHINRVADSLGTGGLLMYVQVWRHWACWCQCHSSLPAEAPLSLVLDYLHASDHLKRKKDSKPSRTRMTTHIKALRWVALKLDLPVFKSLQSQTVSDFLKSQSRIPFEKSEATPILIAVLAAWEQRILSDESSLPEIITLGCFLIATMASLRFRDLLQTKPDSITIQGHILRGISWRTKTSVSGQPWGVCCLGIVTRPSVKHWVFRFLEAVQIGKPWPLKPSMGTRLPSSHHGQTLFHFLHPAPTTMH